MSDISELAAQVAEKMGMSRPYPAELKCGFMTEALTYLALKEMADHTQKLMLELDTEAIFRAYLEWDKQ